jgi:hypothetical protein
VGNTRYVAGEFATQTGETWLQTGFGASADKAWAKLCTENPALAQKMWAAYASAQPETTAKGVPHKGAPAIYPNMGVIVAKPAKPAEQSVTPKP